MPAAANGTNLGNYLQQTFQRTGKKDTIVKKLRGIQYLRGLAALFVVIFHASSKAGYDFRIGEAGVDLFFVLSGFLMVAITDERTQPLTFLADRIRRIVPIYWIATSTMLAGVVAGLFPKVILTVWHVISSYSFIPSRSPSNGEIWPLLVPGWTLNYEMAFYVVFAALMPLGSQIRQVIAMTLIFSVLILAGALVGPTGPLGVTYTNPILLEFAAGTWIGLAWKSEAQWHRLFGLPGIAAAAAMFVLVGAAQTDQARVIIFGLPAALLLASVLGMERRKPIAQWSFPLILGDASYSVYLWHTLAISVAAKLCEKLHLPAAAIIPIGILAGVSAGLVGFKLIEEPIMRSFRARRYAKGAAVVQAPS